MERWPLPEGWEWVPLGSLGTTAGGFGFPKEYQGKNDLRYPFIKVSDMNSPGNEVFISKAANTVDDQILSQIGARAFPSGTIIFPKIGGAIATNKIRILAVDAAFDNNIMGFQPNLNLVETMWCYHFLRSINLIELAHIGPVPSIRQGAIQALEIPLPYPDDPARSLETQRRIVARLDALLAEVAAARRLHAEIVADTARVMEAVRDEVFSELARHAPQVQFSEIAESRLGKMLSQASKTGVYSKPYLRNANVLWDEFKLDDVYEMDFLPEEREEFLLKPGDLLICEGGEIGRCAVWEGQIEECYFQKALHRARLKDPQSPPRYLMHFIAWAAKHGSIAELRTGSAIPHLTGVKLRTLEVIWPEPEVQHQVVATLDQIKAEIAEMGVSQSENTVLLDQIEQAILAQAFRGEL